MLQTIVPILAIAGFATAISASSDAVPAELHAPTLAAFNRYVALTEAQRAADTRFLWVDGDTPADRRRLDQVRVGTFLIEPLETRDHGQRIAIPDGLVHHWIGVVFVPGATADQTLSLLQNYDRHAEIYKPNVARSRLVSRNGDDFKVYLRFFMKKVITVVMNSEHEAHFTRDGPSRFRSRIVSTRIAEVENPDTPREREKPVGNDGGYMWRLNSYWRVEERDGGVYIQCESISLTRDIPFGVGWIVRPFVTSIPRETLTFTLETTRKALQGGAARR
jgi:hypothetical protein